MNKYTLAKNGLVAIAGDEALNVIAVTNYGRSVEVKEAPPPDGLPGEDECPYFMIHSPNKMAGTSLRQIRYELFANLFVYDNNEETVAQSNVEIPTASSVLSQMEARIITLMWGVRPTNSEMIYESASDCVTLWPLIGVDFRFEYTEPWTTGMNPLE